MFHKRLCFQILDLTLLLDDGLLKLLLDRSVALHGFQDMRALRDQSLHLGINAHKLELEV